MCLYCKHEEGCSCYCSNVDLQAVEYSPRKEVHIAYCSNCGHEVHLVFYYG